MTKMNTPEKIAARAGKCQNACFTCHLRIMLIFF